MLVYRVYNLLTGEIYECSNLRYVIKVAKRMAHFDGQRTAGKKAIIGAMANGGEYSDATLEVRRIPTC